MFAVRGDDGMLEGKGKAGEEDKRRLLNVRLKLFLSGVLGVEPEPVVVGAFDTGCCAPDADPDAVLANKELRRRGCAGSVAEEVAEEEGWGREVSILVAGRRSPVSERGEWRRVAPAGVST